MSGKLQLNKLGILVGPSEFGKSTVVRGEVLAHLKTYPDGLAFVHDPHGEYVPDICRGYASPADARAEIEKNARTTPRGFAIRGSSSEVRDLAIEIGKRFNKKDDVSRPIIQVDDESSLMDSSSKNHVSKEDLDFISNRRHYGIYKLLNVQSVRALTEAWFSNATDVWIFSQNNESDARELELRLGLVKGSVQSSPIWRSPPHRYLRWVRYRVVDGVARMGELL